MSDKQELDPIYKMDLHDVLTMSQHATQIMRVPGGWIYMSHSENGAGGYDMTSCFVAFNNEFQP